MSAATSFRHSGASDESSSRRVRKALLRDIDRDLKKKAQATLADLRARLRAARAAHKEALKGAVARCREHRLAVREKLQAERAQALAELRAKGEAERDEARGVCAVDKGDAERATRGAVEGARAELGKERAYQEDLKRIERGNRASSRTTKRATAAERRSESDDVVRGNIPPELVGLFERIKRSIKGGPRETRTEAFLRWAEEHPSEYLEAMEDKTEALIRDLERQQREAVRNPATTAEARKQYERDHWGQNGAEKVRKLPAADPRVPSVELGELIMVVYRTKKGADQVLTDYEHEFAHPRPRLAYNESGLIIAGGRYRIETRGIVD
ncbi:MAG: hypothetical protein ACLQVI_22535 [Polyangiaceae bacterium]